MWGLCKLQSPHRDLWVFLGWVPPKTTSPRECRPVPCSPGGLPLTLAPCFAHRYLALYAYKPQKSDELELHKGEMYRVLEKCQDGWFKGASLRTGVSGVFPGNYVTPVSR